ncbi:hypothetical protein [Alicyclobacillus acidoterrestris]|uniref:Uncharacterized protein n=1 Tax=Alicyclobacillus acidoterrestris (strain ATCC 49025 / DSM 3922 / CIP 106132 / NCIMB 13137 / GD3B) TaxID=1356854 RepID=T0CKP8_ALIAG|nr:hypothetical protein [Alicyclobacillus acidoterrestris]EPZ53080.1 hypothetical protein N007_18295 [Alicyclobacillus acidoterrestris ATCC 49025]UNO49382.1 hypothetical protein K1I37_02155 [Alicyclobacillus acidoterrestris]
MGQTQTEQRVTVTLDRQLIDKIIAFNCFNRQTYIEWEKPLDLICGLEEKLYMILQDTNEIIETAKRELEGYFTDDEATLLFVCLSDMSLGWHDWTKPERDIPNLIERKKNRLVQFYHGAIPIDTVKRVCQKAAYLTPTQCHALIKISHDMRHMTKGDTLRFSNNDIAHYFRTSGFPGDEKWYEIEIH